MAFVSKFLVGVAVLYAYLLIANWWMPFAAGQF